MALLQPRGPGIPGLPPTSLVSPVLICWCGFLLAPLERVFFFLEELGSSGWLSSGVISSILFAPSIGA